MDQMCFDMHHEVAEALLGFLEADHSSLFSSLERDIAAATKIPPASSPNCNNDVCEEQQPPAPIQLDPTTNCFFYPSAVVAPGGCGGGKALSAQTVAARKRRMHNRKKMLELGGLVPGGAKLSTADMLLTGSKHMKYLKAQAVVLQHMPASIPESKCMLIAVLLASRVIQEKLAAHEMCLVPSEMMD